MPDPDRRARTRSSSTSTRVGICGTDVELFTGEMAYLHDRDTRTYPLRLGHEWCGTRHAPSAPASTSSWLGRRVTGDTMLGCGALPPLPRRAPARLREPVRGRHPRRLSRRARRAAAVSRRRALLRAARRRRRHRGRDGRARRQRAARRPGRRRRRPASDCSSSAPAPSACWPRSSPAPTASRCTSPGSPGRVAGVRRERCGLGDTSTARRPARPAVRRRHRRVQRDDGPGPRGATWSSPAGASSSSASPPSPASSTPATIALKDVTAVGILGASAGLAGHHRGVRLRRGRPAPARRRRPSASTRRTTRWPAGDPTTPTSAPKIHVDPRLQEMT